MANPSAMDTTQFAILSTTIVGVAAAGAPAWTAAANRRHDRKMARSNRLYDQRRGAYQQLGRFLEDQRLMLEREGRDDDGEPPPEPTDAEWADVQALAGVTGSATVHSTLQNYYSARGEIIVFALLGLGPEQRTKAMREARARATEAIDAAERAMREELEHL